MSEQSKQAADWWKSAVVYQVYPRSFADSTGDGIGDLPGITSKLDYLAELGVDIVWLSPVYPSPQDDNGYDISDYEDVDSMFGTLADLDRLIAGLHERGMKLVMDLVVNHTSDEHSWFEESRTAGSDRRDWYWWRPARDGFEPGSPGAEPTNWGSFFSGSAWAFDEASGEYYLHLFSPKQPDLNWENPAVRQAVYAMMNRWVERGVDGFRMDVINLISKPYELLDAEAAPGSTFGFPAEVAGGPRLHEFLTEMHAAVMAGPAVTTPLITVGEMPGATPEQARLYTDPARRELDMVFTFEHMGVDSAPGGSKWDVVPLSLPALKGNLARWQQELADVGWNSLYWNNHDQPRVVSRFGDDSPQFRVASAKTLGTVLHLHRGTPYVYQGEELGMTNAGFTSIEQYRDLESLNHFAEATAQGAEPERILPALAFKGRDNARTPMQWDGSDQAGFTTGTPWLPVTGNSDVINAAVQRHDPDSVFHHYRRLISLRHDHDVVQRGRFELLLPEHDQLWVLTRTLDDQTVVMIANCSSVPVEVPPGTTLELDAAELLLATHPDTSGSTLAPWESRVWLITQEAAPKAATSVVLGNSSL